VGGDTGPWFDNDGPAAPGASFPPATTDRFDLTYWFGWINIAVVTYEFEDKGKVTLRAVVDNWNITSMTCVKVDAPLHCTSTGAVTNNLSATITSATASTTVLTGDQKQAQAAALNALCDTHSALASCLFSPKEHLIHSYGITRVIGHNQHLNCKTQGVDTVRLSWAFEEGGWQSIGTSLNFGVQLSKTVELGISAAYQRAWSWSRTYTETHDLQVFPGYTAWFEHTPARLRVTGDFTAIVGNDTLLIQDVTFEAPSTDLDTRGVLVSKERLLTPEERRNHCGSVVLP
jgi:hypothetical protein